MDIINMKDLIIIGAGDVGKYIAYHFGHLEDYKIIGFLDDDKSKWGKLINNIPVLGDWTYLMESANVAVVLGIANPLHKIKIWNNIKDFKHLSFPNMIHPFSWIGANITLGKGIIIYPGVTINYETVIEDFVTINMNCSLGHNAHISKFSTLSPSVNLGGYTEIGELSFIGIGVNTIQSTKIGKNTIIGGASMIIKDIPDNCTVVGNPGKIIKQLNNE